MLLGTLRTYQRTGCDHDMVTLKCPHGTTISVQLAQYGKVFPDQRLCSQGPTTPAPVSRNSTCLLPQAVQVSSETKSGCLRYPDLYHVLLDISSGG